MFHRWLDREKKMVNFRQKGNSWRHLPIVWNCVAYIYGTASSNKGSFMRDGIIRLVVSCRIVSHNHIPAFFSALLSLFQWKVRRTIRPSSVARLSLIPSCEKSERQISFYRDDDNDINNINKKPNVYWTDMKGYRHW